MGLREQVVDTVQTLSGRHDQPELYGGPAGDPGLCGGPDSVSWRVHGDLGAVATAGVAAIVLEILHPSVMAGVQEHSAYRQDPFRRGQSTMGYVLGTTFGNTEAATRLIGTVKKIHGRVNGARPDGVAYQALDPSMLAWVHTCIPWMVMTAYERFNRPLTPRARDRYLAEQAVVGRMAGARDVPETMDELTDFVASVRPRLAVTEQTREFFDFLMTPQLPRRIPMDSALQRFYVRAGMSLTPAWAQRLTGLQHAVRLGHLLDGTYLQSQARLIRWAFPSPPYLAMAHARTSTARP